MLKRHVRAKVVGTLNTIPNGSYSDLVFFVRRTGDRKVWGVMESNTSFLTDFLVDLAEEHPEFDEALMEAYYTRAEQKEEEELRKEAAQ